jgi:hypothetical protein
MHSLKLRLAGRQTYVQSLYPAKFSPRRLGGALLASISMLLIMAASAPERSHQKLLP